MMFGKARLHLAALLAAAAFLLLWPGDLSAQNGGSNFNPDVNVEVDGYWVSGEENVRINSNLYANNVMYDAWVQFTPADWLVATGSSVPDGAQVGDAWIGMNVGFDNGPCNTWVQADVTTLDCTTNTAVTVSFADGFADANSNGLPDACDKYPAFLKTLFPGITPRARYYGQADVYGSPTSLNFVVFEPGTTLYGTAFDPGSGYPMATVFNDPTAAPAPSATTDVCTNWQRYESFWQRSSDNPDTFANEDGYLLRRNPSDWGNYNFATFVRGRPDADGDGIENQLDTCPLDGNWDENPRNGNGPDGDGLDSVCDPAWDVYNEDQDGDGYLNRGDNCPLNANGVGGTNQADTDKDGIGNVCDPHPSSVDGAQEERWSDFWVEVTGDSDNDGWSDALERLAGSDPNWEMSTPEGLWRSPQACSDGLDNDLDGLVDGYDLGCDRDNDRVANMFDACPEDPEDQDGFEDSDGCPDNDNDNDGFPDVTDDCPATDWTAGPDDIPCNGDDNVNTCEDYDGIIDTDGCHDSPGDDYDADRFTDEEETYMGTDPTDACPDAPGHDAWPPDIAIDERVDVFDALTFLAAFPSAPGSPKYTQRLEFSPDGVIDVFDALTFLAHFPSACTNP
jgi:hypothetical protein